jgi:hypothetical protein
MMQKVMEKSGLVTVWAEKNVIQIKNKRQR